MSANGIERSLAIQGGEPLCPENIFLTNLVIIEVKKKLPDTKIYIWTGYLYEELLERAKQGSHLKNVLDNTNVLIDGPFIEAQRDVTLPMRGSRNQRIINLKTGEIFS